MTDRPPISETIKAKLEELDVEQRLEELVHEVSEFVSHGVSRAGGLVHEHRDDISAFLDRAAEFVDRGFDHRQTARVEAVRGQLERGVDRIAEHRPPAPSDTTESSTEPPAEPPTPPPPADE